MDTGVIREILGTHEVLRSIKKELLLESRHEKMFPATSAQTRVPVEEIRSISSIILSRPSQSVFSGNKGQMTSASVSISLLSLEGNHLI